MLKVEMVIRGIDVPADAGSGHKSQELLDEATVLSSMTYVDL